MKKFVIEYSCGEYDCHISGPLAIYDTREEAESFIESEKAWKRKVKSLAIRDIESWEKDYIETEDGNCPGDHYYHLETEFRDWLWKKFMGDKDDSELTEEDYQRYDEISEDEWFPKYMKDVKGYSDDVIEATLEYNDSNDHSRYNTYYHISEVPYNPEPESLINERYKY